MNPEGHDSGDELKRAKSAIKGLFVFIVWLFEMIPVAGMGLMILIPLYLIIQALLGNCSWADLFSFKGM